MSQRVGHNQSKEKRGKHEKKKVERGTRGGALAEGGLAPVFGGHRGGTE